MINTKYKFKKENNKKFILIKDPEITNIWDSKLTKKTYNDKNH